MDPKQLNQLDPKLQEAYNRVMGTAVSQPASTPPPPNEPTPPPPPQPPPAPTTEAPPVAQTPEPVSEAQADTAAPVEDTVSATIDVSPSPAASGYVTPATQHKRSIPSVILFVGGIVFFVVYAIVWIRVFNLQIPFLTQ